MHRIKQINTTICSSHSRPNWTATENDKQIRPSHVRCSMPCVPASLCLVDRAGFAQRFQINYDIKCVRCERSERDREPEIIYQNDIIIKLILLFDVVGADLCDYFRFFHSHFEKYAINERVLHRRQQEAQGASHQDKTTLSVLRCRNIVVENTFVVCCVSHPPVHRVVSIVCAAAAPHKRGTIPTFQTSQVYRELFSE